MPSITIPDVPDQTRDELSRRAARSGRALEEAVRGWLIDLAARPDGESIWARIRERKRVTGSSLPAETILDLRERGRQ